MTAKKYPTQKNYEFFVKTDISRYKGEWLAIKGNKIITHGKDAEKVYKRAIKLARSTNISLAKAPDEQMVVLTFAQ